MAPLTSPLWLTAPTRYARLSKPQARWAATILAALLALSFTALLASGPPPISSDPADRANDRADVMLYQGIVAGIRAGGNYYAVAADAQRAGGYPMRPFVTMRLPTLAVLQAALPDLASTVLLYLLAAGTFLAWFLRLRPVFVRPPPLLIALALLAGGMMAFVQAELVPFHEIWAGLLIALSLAVWRPGRWIEAVAIAACAMLIRETATLYAIVMAAAALVEGRRRECIGWGAALGLLAVAVAIHFHAWSQIVRPDDPASPGWSGLLGPGFFVRTMAVSTALALLPLALAAPLVALALFGWSAWASPTAARMLATLVAYAVLISLFGRTDTFYWGLLVAPAMLVGLAFMPDAVRDLARRLLDKRRITVTRIAP